MDWFGEWRDLATWWHAMTPNPAEFWYGAGVIVNLLLALVGAFAFKTNRDMAKAAQEQTQLAVKVANKAQADQEMALRPNLVGYVLPLENRSICSVRVVNTGNYPIVFHGSGAEFHGFDGSYRIIHPSQYMSFVSKRNPSPYCAVNADYWLADFFAEASTGLDGDLEYSFTCSYLSPERSSFVWTFRISVHDIIDPYIHHSEITPFDADA